MRSRKYNRRVTFKLPSRSDDGYGGKTASTPTTVSTRWARVRTMGAQRKTEYGIDAQTNAATVDLRASAEVNYQQNGLFLLIGGDRYTINTVEELNEAGMEVRIVAVREE